MVFKRWLFKRLMFPSVLLLCCTLFLVIIQTGLHGVMDRMLTSDAERHFFMKGGIHTAKTWLKRVQPNNETTKPKQLVPKSVQESLAPSEWISETIIDLKTSCPVLKNENNDNMKSEIACRIPKLNPFHPSMMNIIKDVPMPQCSRFKSYGALVDGKIQFIDNSVVSATYRPFFRKGDNSIAYGKPTAVVLSERIKDEFVEVEYLLKGGKRMKEVFAQPVRREHLVQRKNGEKKPGLPLDVLIVGVDSISHANSQRKLPAVYELLKSEFGSFIFNGHSIVGDGTTEQLTAMLCGLGEFEQYESRRHHKNPRPVDGWAWIYKQLKEHGYLTGYAADAPSIGAFQFRLMGFKDAPTDFYLRPFFQAVEHLMKGGANKCLSSKTISKTMFDYVNEVFRVFPDIPKFFFSFNVQYSHATYSEASMIEPDLLSFLKEFRANGHLNNTLLIVMGDHGSRYGPARAQIQGKLEERLPLFTMTFPSWFRSRYPTIVENLRKNTERLTSWYDVYVTFRHMLSFPELPRDVKHGRSLLQEVPLSRTCFDAAVPEHWCPCLELSAINVNHSHVRNAALAAVQYINTMIDEHQASKDYCQVLSLGSINYALLERPNDKVLAFAGTRDGGIPNYGKKSKPSHQKYCRFQLQFVTSPNNGVYEATVRYHEGWFIVSRSISRVNQYGDQPECIATQLPHLRKFCLCTVATDY